MNNLSTCKLKEALQTHKALTRALNEQGEQ